MLYSFHPLRKEPAVMGAVVIPFSKTATKGSSQEYLRKALEELQSALGEQKRALSEWKFAMTELGIGVAGLGHALGSYQGSLSGVETRLNGLRTEAGRLQGWADSVLTQAAARHHATASTVSSGE